VFGAAVHCRENFFLCFFVGAARKKEVKQEKKGSGPDILTGEVEENKF